MLARERVVAACFQAGVVACTVCRPAVSSAAMLVLRPLVLSWSTCPSCRHWSTLCARLCVRGRGVCSQGNAGPWHAPALCCCVCGLCSCSLSDNNIGDAGAAAIGAGLVHLPQLQTLKYVVRPVVCTGPRPTVSTGPWRVLAQERGAMVCACTVPLCVWFVFVQPCVQLNR